MVLVVVVVVLVVLVVVLVVVGLGRVALSRSIHTFTSSLLTTIIHTLCMCLCMSVEQPWLGCLALQSM